MAAQQNFRTAFNGFNREDVVHYIEYLNAKHTAELNQLRSEVEFLRSKLNPESAPEQEDHAQRCQELEEQLSAAQEACASLETQLNEAMDAGVEIEKQLNAALAEKAQLEEALEAARKEQHSAQSRTADELAAYRRAERTERMARERVEQMYRQATGVIADASAKVDEAASQIGSLSEGVLAQLEQLKLAVSGSNDALKDASAIMYTIRPETEE